MRSATTAATSPRGTVAWGGGYGSAKGAKRLLAFSSNTGIVNVYSTEAVRNSAEPKPAWVMQVRREREREREREEGEGERA